jgi:hypothetical protein
VKQKRRAGAAPAAAPAATGFTPIPFPTQNQN